MTDHSSDGRAVAGVPRVIRRRLESDFDLSLTPAQWSLVERYLKLLLRWRRPAGLTALRDPEEQLRLHFFESFWVADHFLEGTERLADVGSGAGFPGLAFQIYQPGLRVTLLEPNLKKVVFLHTLVRDLELKARILRLRGEDYREWEEEDLATMRALKPSAALLGLLARHRVPLLLFHGRLEEPLSRLRPLCSERIPGSRQRFAGLFET